MKVAYVVLDVLLFVVSVVYWVHSLIVGWNAPLFSPGDGLPFVWLAVMWVFMRNVRESVEKLS